VGISRAHIYIPPVSVDSVALLLHIWGLWFQISAWRLAVLTKGFSGFPQFLHIHLYSLFILPFDAIQPETMRALLKEKKINRSKYLNLLSVSYLESRCSKWRLFCMYIYLICAVL
jgi:hypothetical protein